MFYWCYTRRLKKDGKKMNKKDYKIDGLTLEITEINKSIKFDNKELLMKFLLEILKVDGKSY